MEPTNQGEAGKEAVKLSQVIQIDEGKIQEHLGEVVRSTVEETLNAMLDAEADRLCRAECYERPLLDRLRNYRHVCKTRVLGPQPRTAVARCCWNAPSAELRAVMSTAGSGTVFRDGRTGSGASVGDAAHVLDSAIRVKAALLIRGGPISLLLMLPCPDLPSRAWSRGFPT